MRLGGYRYLSVNYRPKAIRRVGMSNEVVEFKSWLDA